MSTTRNIVNKAYEKIKFLKYFSLLKRTKVQFFIAVLAGILYGISSGFGIPVILKISTEKIFSREFVSVNTLILVSLAPVVAMTCRAIFSVLNSYCLSFCGQTILRELRVKIFEKIQKLPLEYFKTAEPGVVITRSLSDTTILQETIISVSQEIIKQPIALLGALGALIFLCCQQSDVVILLIFLLAAALVVFPIKAIGNKLRKKALGLQLATEGLTTKLTHNLSAVQEIRAFGMEDREVARYRDLCDHVMRTVMKTLKYSIIVSPIIEVIASCGVGLAMFYAYNKHIGAEVFISLTGALYLSYEPIKKIAELNSRIKTGSASLMRIEDLLSFPDIICDPVHPIPVGKLAGDISFSHVTFSYGDKVEALSDVTITLARGKTYALVGSSGAGKTTLANLILRFYDVNLGAITIDGIDIRDMKISDLRKNISYVPQSPTLVNGTIADNIKWSVPQASFEAIMEAAKQAYAHSFIADLADGYDTLVGEGGMRLSGGQKQRIALARAFLRNAPILILDEATSALDANSEHEVHIGVENLTKDRTTLLISHRFTMMAIVDTVFVLERGKVMEIGSPDELLQNHASIYYSLYQMQQGRKSI